MNGNKCIGCVVMASGLGRRFGGNKLAAPIAGKPMIQWTLEAAEGLFDAMMVVTRHTEIRDLCRRMDIPVILHSLPHRSDTIRLGLQAILQQGNMDGCLFCPGDQPLLSRRSMESLIHAFESAPECIHRLGNGMPVIFPRWAFGDLLRLPEGSGGNVILKSHPENVRAAMPVYPEETMDADTPEMLRLLEEILLQRRI